MTQFSVSHAHLSLGEFFRRRKVKRLFYDSRWEEREVQGREVLMRQEELRNFKFFQEEEPRGGNCLRKSGWSFGVVPRYSYREEVGEIPRCVSGDPRAAWVLWSLLPFPEMLRFFIKSPFC